MKTVPRIRLSALVATAALILAAGRVHAQFPLSPALWDENISLSADGSSASFQGSDAMMPEPRTEELSGTGFDVTGSVAFGETATPQGTAEVTWDVPSGGLALNLSSILSIDFQARVIETSAPPVSVTEVPVRLLAAGSAAVDDVFGSRATSSFRFQVVGTGILITANLDVGGDGETATPATDGFAIDESPAIPVDALILVSMSASASMGVVSLDPGGSGSATGMVDPVIEVVDELIPGTSSSYRDFFTVEFSEGIDRTPTERVSLGGIKRRFSSPR